MTGELVFITGGSGHLGYRVIFDALEAGYHVRAAVRSQDKADKILAAPSVKSLSPGNKLEFAFVPDMLADGAYDEAIKGATYAIHIASPITSAYKEGDDMEKVFIEPALKGTISILSAAQKTSSIKRVVITSSVVAIIPWKDFTSGSCETVFDEKSRTAFLPGPYSGVFEAYAASKINALNETEAWIAREKPTFDVVNIFPGFIIGRDELVVDLKDAMLGTNKEVLFPVTGGDDGYIPGCSIHVNDVALAHVKALAPTVPGNQGYILASEGLKGTSWEKSMEIVAKEFPAAVKSGALANNGKTVTLPVKIDESTSEALLGMKYQGFADQVKNVVAHYLELVAAAAA